jgi:hypothetical protein
MKRGNAMLVFEIVGAIFVLLFLGPMLSGSASVSR